MESWLSEKIIKVDNPLARRTKKKSKSKRERKRIKVHKIREGNGAITTDTTEIQRVIKDYCEQLDCNKFDTL